MGVVLLISFQSFIISVEANAGVISVSTYGVDYGIVFPGEQLEKEFIVYLATTTEVEYIITQTPKPGSYSDLCPFLEKISEEGEGDTATSSTVSPADPSDTWKIIFKVPAILGFVAQDHIFGIVSNGGDYGCDIGVEIIE